ncbi:toxin-antitoxin system YwqK family antitoxin [bacterium SCSIO 12741]|nr:toxin-antitoxin system YwqK family antitoxin [bacterium SCSIO 12741]
MKHLLWIIIPLFLLSCEEQGKPEKSKKPRNGVYETFREGKLYSKVNYKDGKRHGLAQNFYPDGKVKVEYNYKNNVKEGPFRHYYENGKVYQEVEYLEGVMHGIERKYYETGALLSEMPWKQGRPGKGLKEYTREGKLKKKIPKIVVEEDNTAALDGQVLVTFKLDKKFKDMDFYRGFLDEDGFLTENYEDQWLGSKKAKFERFVPRGGFLMETMQVVVKVKTRSRNYYVLEKEYNLAVNN